MTPTEKNPTTFQMVSKMNEAFGNPKGDPLNIDWNRVRSQFKNVADELGELFIALGAEPLAVERGVMGLKDTLKNIVNEPDLPKVRDASRDIVVFADGGHHFMGIDGDRDMKSVIDGVMTRFVKNPDDLLATQDKHRAKGVHSTYTEGWFPVMIVKSAEDQPDAPKGKFLKSASYVEPVFYDVAEKNFEKSFPISDDYDLATEKDLMDHPWTRTTHDHVWKHEPTGKYHYSDEAEQIDPTPYDTLVDAHAALSHYVDHVLNPSPSLTSQIFSPESQQKLMEAGFKANSLDAAKKQANGETD